MRDPSAEPPLRTAARYLAETTKSVACSIYALASEDTLTSERLFYLAGTFGCDSDTRGPSAEFSITNESYEKIKTDRKWTGFTTFVALSEQSLRVGSVESPQSLFYEGTQVEVVRDPTFSELAKPGPFLCVPVKDGRAVVGVVRVQRREENDASPYTEEHERDLKLLAPLLAMSMTLEQARTRVLRVVGDLSEKKDESALLEAIAENARNLVQAEHHAASVFLEEPVRDQAADGRRRFRFRAPMEAEPLIERKVYYDDDPGLTGTVIRRNVPILSLNLQRDLAEGGPLAEIKHRPQDAETSASSTRSWLGVPIPGAESGEAIGVIRIASSELAAFSVRDQETLRVLAHQASAILRAQRQLAQQTRAYNTLIELTRRPTISVEDRKIQVINDAALELLGCSREDVMRPEALENVIYGGNRAMAGGARRALDAAGEDGGDGKLRGYYTLAFRRSEGDESSKIPIPVRMDAQRIRDPASGEFVGAIGVLEDLRDPGKKMLPRVARFGPPGSQGITVDPDVSEQLSEIERLPDDLRQIPILIVGETGTGKELVVDMLRQRALERNRKAGLHDDDVMRKFNCAEFPESLLESELFGYVTGAFTGAKATKAGVFDPAYFAPNKRRMLFLDEIAELSLSAQAKLLRVLDKNVVRKVGAVEEEPLEVELVAATWADLEQRVQEGRFRRDLKNRLECIVVRMPALRERRNDIMLLALHFLNGDRAGDKPLGFSSDAIRALLEAEWHGNIRELRQAVLAARAVYEARGAHDSRLIRREHLWQRLRLASGAEPAVEASAVDPQELSNRTPWSVERPSGVVAAPRARSVTAFFEQQLEKDPENRRRFVTRDPAFMEQLVREWGSASNQSAKYIRSRLNEFCKQLSKEVSTKTAP